MISCHKETWSDSLYSKVRKNDFIRHIKQLNIGDQFNALDNDSDQYWHNVAVTAFKLVFNFVAIFINAKRINHRCFSGCLTSTSTGLLTRKSFDGWPPPSSWAGKQSTWFLRWELFSRQFTDEWLATKAFPGAKVGREHCHVLIWDDLQYAANDQHYAEQRGGSRLQCTLVVGRELTSATHRCRNCKTAALFAFAAKQLHFSSSSCQRCDLDRNGKLDYQEFKAMIFRSRERKEALLREEQEQARKTQMSDLASSNEITTFLFIFLLIHGDSNFMFQAKLKGRRKSVGKKKKKVPTNKKKEKKEKKGAKKKK